MKLRHCIFSSFFVCVLAVLIIGASYANTGRALSLNALAAAVKSDHAGDALHLCGITKPIGYIEDTKNDDIILIGEADPKLPPLYADDLIVAMRNEWLLYAQNRSRVFYYSAPGCSIDPDPKVLNELQQLNSSKSGGVEDAFQEYLKNWNSIGGKPQKVRVLGIPFDTRFARVMVEADYFMKRLVNGSASLNIKGFKSLSEMSADEVKDNLARGKPAERIVCLNRFWFNPGKATYSGNNGVFKLRECEVQLLTEEEYLSEQGMTSSGRSNSMAKQFARNFSEHYGEIADAYPIYAELQNLFRLVGIAKLMKDNAASCSSLDYLLKSFPMDKIQVQRDLPGLTNVKEVTDEKETRDGKITTRVVLPSCGGVNIDIRLQKTQSDPASDQSLKKSVLGARKSPKTLFWDFPMKDGN